MAELEYSKRLLSIAFYEDGGQSGKLYFKNKLIVDVFQV